MATRIGLVMFPNLTQLDLTGPFEVFKRIPNSEVLLVAESLDLVRADTGLRMAPDVSFSDCPQLDVVCVPGGPGADQAMENKEVIAFLRKQAPGLRFITSVCTGAMVLGAAGLLVGKKATTHWTVRDLLKGLGAEPVNARVVRDGNVFTGGGVTAGIDFALTVAAELAGEKTAQEIQLLIEYTPEPPYNAGSPETAPTEIVEGMREKGASRRAGREAIVARVAAAGITAP